MRVRFTKELEQRDLEAFFLGITISDQRWELEVISNEDEFFCKTEGSQAGWERYLRCFVDNAVVEFSPRKQRTSWISTDAPYHYISVTY